MAFKRLTLTPWVVMIKGRGLDPMKTKLIAAGALLAAFLIGVVTAGYIKPALGSASTTASLQPAPVATSRAVRAPAPYAVETPAGTVQEQPRVSRHRPWERQVLIVAGSAGAGAGIGALAGGKKGAGIGALSGGVAGLIYDLATRNK